MHGRNKAKEFLSELSRARKRISEAEQRMSALYTDLQPRGAGTSDVCVHSQDISDPTAAMAVRLYECRNQLESARAGYRLAMARVEYVFNAMPDSDEKIILQAHYVAEMPLDRVRERVPWLKSWAVYRKLQQGLDVFGEIVKKIYG